MKATFATIVAALLLGVPHLPAQEAFDPTAVALTYHKLTGEELDLQRAADESDAVRHASNFDRPDVAQAQVKKLQAELTQADPSREFVIHVIDNISQYDREQGDFSISLFSPGFFIPMDAFGQQYRLVFANAEASRSIPMPKDEARTFDAKLNAIGRSVTNEIHFKVVGKGDPAGGVAGERVIRGEIVSTRLLDRDGRVVFTPRVASAGATAAARAASDAAFDARKMDVAGFRVGVSADDLKATLERLYGKVSKGGISPGGFKGYVAEMSVNSMKCETFMGRRDPTLGTVCVTAYLDKDDVVRAVRVERLFPLVQYDVFRKSLIKKYGPVTKGVGSALGWGPTVAPSAGYGSTPGTALSAHYLTDESMAMVSGNSIPNTRILLQLVDANWVAAQK